MRSGTCRRRSRSRPEAEQPPDRLVLHLGRIFEKPRQARPRLWPPNCSVATMPTRTTEATEKEKGPDPSENPGAPSLVRGGGLERPWLLTASTSSRSGGSERAEIIEFPGNCNVRERQNTAHSGHRVQNPPTM